MQLKTYRANSMAEALAEVKQDLGSDAVILHARSVKIGGIMGVGARNQYEITASTAAAAPAVRPRPAARPDPRSVADRANQTKDLFEPATFAPATLRPNQASTQGPAPVPTPTSSSVPTLGPVDAPAQAPVVAPGTTSGQPRANTLQSPAPFAPARPATRGGAPAAPLRLPAQDVDASSLVSPVQEDRPGLPHVEPKPYAAGESGVQRATVPSTRVSFRPSSREVVQSIESELESIKRLLGQVLQQQWSASARVGQYEGPVRSENPLSDLYLRLTERRVAPALASRLTGEIRDALERDELADGAIVRSALLSRMASLIRISDSFSSPPPAGKSASVIAVVGPTGVGKTTSIAKMAATCRLRHAKRVGLLTCDTYRIAAVEQLRTYASILGLPLKVALTPMELVSARAELGDCDVIFVDTPGRAPSDTRRVDELRRFVEAIAPTQTFFALAASSDEDVLRRSLRAFAPASPDRVLLTKIDEAESLGAVFSVLCESGLPLSCVTTGQEVPDDLEAADSERFARWVLDGHRPPRALD